MKFMVLAYNPKYINPVALENFITDIKFDFPGLKVYVIPQMNDTDEAIYCVQFVDTERRI